jgi:hypothetical protein
MLSSTRKASHAPLLPVQVMGRATFLLGAALGLLWAAQAEAFLSPLLPLQRAVQQARWSATADQASVPTGSDACGPICGDGDVVFEAPLAAQTNRFIVDIGNPEVTAEELAETNVVKIVRLECTDQEVNWLAWKCLGELRACTSCGCATRCPAL